MYKFIWVDTLAIGLMLLVGCSPAVVTKDDAEPDPSRVQTIAIKGFDQNENMRPLGDSNVPPVNVTIQQEHPPRRLADGNYECDPGFVPSYGDIPNVVPSVKMIRGVGYGAPPKAYYPPPQRRLMTMRAAKVDAFRDLAEKVGGVRVFGNTTVSEMVVNNDKLRALIDTHIRNANIVAINPLEDGTYEVIMEVELVNTELAKKEKEERTPRCIPFDALLEKQGANL